MAANDYSSANERALETARLVFPNAMWHSFRQKGFVQFSGSRGTYVISPHALTQILDANGQLIGEACLQLSISAPAYDRMLAEYLILKNAEDFYWSTANIFPNSGVGFAELLLASINFALLFHLLMLL